LKQLRKFKQQITQFLLDTVEKFSQIRK